MIRKLVLFDIDGTLLRSNGASREAKAQAMQIVFGTDAGIRHHPFGGKTDWQILREVLEPQGINSEQIGREMPRYEEVFAEKLAAIMHEYQTFALPGALDVVTHLKQRPDILIGLITGNTSQTAPVKLRAAGFDPSIFVVGAFGNESDDRNLLAQHAYQRAQQSAGHAIAPSDVIIVGDTVLDVWCARAIGAIAVTVFTGFEERETLIAAQPDFLLEDLSTFLEQVPL